MATCMSGVLMDLMDLDHFFITLIVTAGMFLIVASYKVSRVPVMRISAATQRLQVSMMAYNVYQ